MQLASISLVLAFSLLATLANSKRGPCLSSKVIKPCNCDNEKKLINCSSTTKFNANKVFKTIASCASDEVSFELYADPFPFNVLRANFTRGARFKKIWITNSDLVFIEPGALAGAESIISAILLPNNQLMSLDLDTRGGLFHLLRDLCNLQVVNLQGNHLTSIPLKGFTPSTECNSTTKLWYLDLSKNEIGEIYNFAFTGLDVLTYLDLSHNCIDFIKTDSFSNLWTNSSRPLTLFLNHNNLHDNSFEKDLWSEVTRPLELYLQNNKLTTLKKVVFESLLLSPVNHMIDVNGNSFMCDCRLNWIYRNQSGFESKLKGLECQNGTSIWTSDEYFANCTDDIADEETTFNSFKISQVKNIASREKEEGFDQRLCPIGSYNCGDKTCVPLSRTCNQIKDCKDGDDEDFCETEKKEVVVAMVPCQNDSYESSKPQPINVNLGEVGNKTQLTLYLQIGQKNDRS